jgi:lactate permease
MLPVAVLFFALGVKRTPGHRAAQYALAVTIPGACLIYGMPVFAATAALANGVLFGLLPVGWIVFSAVYLQRVLESTGHFDALKRSIPYLTGDRRLQVLFVAFSVGALIEAASGFGAPVAVCAGLLVGLGFAAEEAAVLCLIANTVPVPFAGAGLPILVAAQVSGLDEMALGRAAGLQLPVLALMVPFLLMWMADGRRGVREMWKPCLLAGGSFALAQAVSARFLGPTLPGVCSGLATVACMGGYLRWRAHRENRKREPGSWKGWVPFVALCAMIFLWSLPGTRAVLDLASARIAILGLHDVVVSATTGKPISAVYNLNWLATPGTAIFLTALFTGLMQGMALTELFRLAGKTLRALRQALLTIVLLMAYAYLSNFAGMTAALGLAAAKAGYAFAAVAPVLGWLGVFITGSNTSSNAFFAPLQRIAAERAGLSAVLAVAANAVGGASGKMVSPQSIAVATAATNLPGREGHIFRAILKPSLLMLGVTIVLTSCQAWFMPGWFSHAPDTSTAASVTQNLFVYGCVWTAGIILVAALLRSTRIQSK